jgi:hypothetical protein
MMTAVRFFETSETNYPSTRRNDPEDLLPKQSRGDAVGTLIHCPHIVKDICISDYCIQTLTEILLDPDILEVSFRIKILR